MKTDGNRVGNQSVSITTMNQIQVGLKPVPAWYEIQHKHESPTTHGWLYLTYPESFESAMTEAVDRTMNLTCDPPMWSLNHIQCEHS